MSLLPDLHCVGDVRFRSAVAVSRQWHCANGPKKALERRASATRTGSGVGPFG